MSVGPFCCRDYFSVGDVVAARCGTGVGNVFADGHAKHDRLLAHHGDVPPQPGRVQIEHVVAVEQDAAAASAAFAFTFALTSDVAIVAFTRFRANSRHLIKACHKLEHRGLARPARADNSRGHTLGHLDGKTLQDGHIGACRIRKRYVLEPQGAFVQGRPQRAPVSPSAHSFLIYNVYRSEVWKGYGHVSRKTWIASCDNAAMRRST
jgi:hypothetical protein